MRVSKVVCKKWKQGQEDWHGRSTELTVYQARGRVGGMGVWTARLPVCYCDRHHDPKQLVEEGVGFIF